MKKTLLFAILIMARICDAAEPNLVAYWKMDNLDINSFPIVTITGTMKPDIIGTGNIYGTNNSKQYYKISNVCGWQIINASAPTITDGNYSSGNVLWDSATGKYWWALLNQDNGTLYFASTTNPTGSWTIERMRRDRGCSIEGARPCLQKFGSTYYCYYWDEKSIYVRSSSEPNGIYLDSTVKICLKPAGGGTSVWDSYSVGEPFVFYNENDSKYYLFYMGYNATLGAPNCCEETGYATCITPDGNFTRYSGNPVLSGYLQTPGSWDDGNVRAADPAVWKSGSRWYISVAACANGYSTVHTGFFYTNDLITFTELSTLNPLLDSGASGQWDANGVWRSGPPFEYGGITYIPYQGVHPHAKPWLTVGLATLTIDPNWYLWWSDPNWILSPTLGTKGTRFWSLDNTNPLGNYTERGTASGTAKSAYTIVEDETGNYNGVPKKNTTTVNTIEIGNVNGKINGCATLDGVNENIAFSASLPTIRTIAMWIKPQNLTTTQTLFALSSTVYLSLAGFDAGIDANGFSSGTNVIYVDGKVDSTIPDQGWHHVVLTNTNGYDGSEFNKIGRRGSGTYYFKGSIDNVRLYNRTLSAEEVGQLYKEGLGDIASEPNPANEETSVNLSMVLNWQSGRNAASHDVYLGTNYNDVNYANESSPEYKGSYDVNRYDPCNLAPTTTYYWRIDEVNGPNLWKGNIWRFETISPSIELSATKFQFYAVGGVANPADQVLGISNSGTGPLNWHVSESCGWLSAEPNNGSSTGETDNVNLSVDISSLTGGVYNCTLTISDPNASNNPRTADVTLRVNDADRQLHVQSEYPTIQAAINAASDGDIVIIVPGTYTDYGNYNLDFGGKAITVRGTDPNDPEVVSATVIDCQSTAGRRGFYFHSGEDEDSIVSGLTIKGGKITGDPAMGGGIYCSGSSPKIENCILTNNAALGNSGSGTGDGKYAYGGGIYCTSNSHITIIDCNISGNTAQGGEGGDVQCTPQSGCYGTLGSGGSAYGGGIYSSSDSSLTIVGCEIANNLAVGGMGGTYYESGSPVEGRSGGYASAGGIYCASGSVANSIINNNTAHGGDGGGAGSISPGAGGIARGGGSYGQLVMRDCIVSQNVAQIGNPILVPFNMCGGGLALSGISEIRNCLVVDNNVIIGFDKGIAIACMESSQVVLSSCTVAGHHGYGSIPAISHAGMGGNLTLSDCILWDNDACDVSGAYSVVYCCTEQDISGTGNIHADPCFVTGPNGDYYLSQIAAGQAVDSPCVDAGSDTAANLGMEYKTTRTDEIGDGDVVDMGYHYSMPNPADIDGDGDVDFFDYAILASQWLQAPGVPSADIAPPGGDGIVDILDLGALADNWLEGF
jgi:hypothetical protein